MALKGEKGAAAVMRAYGFPEGLAESEIVARLFAPYAKLTERI